MKRLERHRSRTEPPGQFTYDPEISEDERFIPVLLTSGHCPLTSVFPAGLRKPTVTFGKLLKVKGAPPGT